MALDPGIKYEIAVTVTPDPGGTEIAVAPDPGGTEIAVASDPGGTTQKFKYEIGVAPDPGGTEIAVAPDLGGTAEESKSKESGESPEEKEDIDIDMIRSGSNRP